MAVPAGTVETFDIRGDREDLQNAIYDISPTETPFMMKAGRGRASAVRHEWQKDNLAGVDGANAALQGDDAAAPQLTATTRLANRTQISTKTVIVSGTADAIDKAGRKSETAYQLAKKAKELKRDMETILCQNQASAVGVSGDGGGGTPQYLGSLETWYETNLDTSGSGGGWTDPDTVVRVDGTQRPLQESLLKSVIRQAWSAGGDPDCILTGPFNKQVISGFTGNATRFDKSEDKRLVTAVDVYVSDFGDHTVYPSRFSRERTVHVLDPSLWSVQYLRSFRQWPLARTGDSEKRQLLVEYTLCSKNEEGSGAIFDLNAS
jgi:hypothetical protein